MTDTQLLIAIKLRVKKRVGNFLFLKILDALQEESKAAPLEQPVVERLREVCRAYGIRLDEFDEQCLASQREATVDQERRKRLRAVGFGV